MILCVRDRDGRQKCSMNTENLLTQFELENDSLYLEWYITMKLAHACN